MNSSCQSTSSLGSLQPPNVEPQFAAINNTLMPRVVGLTQRRATQKEIKRDETEINPRVIRHVAFRPQTDATAYGQTDTSKPSPSMQLIPCASLPFPRATKARPILPVTTCGRTYICNWRHHQTKPDGKSAMLGRRPNARKVQVGFC